MADRARSKDGVKETDDYIDDMDSPSQQGRGGGDLSRKIATKDEEKRRVDGDTSATRVTKKHEKGDGDLGGHHGTDVESDEKGKS